MNKLRHSEIDRVVIKELEGSDVTTKQEVFNILENNTSNIEREFIINISFLSLKELLKELEKKDITLNLDKKKKSVKLFKNGDFIGEIYRSAYLDGNFFSYNHLYKKINSDYRGKGFGFLLFAIYTKITEVEESFILPQEDFSKKVSVINLYKKFGYIIIGKINREGKRVEIDESDYKKIKYMEEFLKENNYERPLSNTIILKK